ncbi:MAG: acetate kinase [Thermoguttaceae bacterium]|nr:acetate kinase [Thermoguttaceae bacterium]MDW8037479.1 acetate kinase [Thermoguttaceae bacterium]
MAILVLNAGSSTVKFALFDFDSLEVLVRGLLDWAGKTGEAMVRLEMPGQPPVRQELEVPSYREAVFAALKLLQKCFGASSDQYRLHDEVGPPLKLMQKCFGTSSLGRAESTDSISIPERDTPEGADRLPDIAGSSGPRFSATSSGGRSDSALPGLAARKIRVVGHRLIHGGEEIRQPVWIDAQMKQTIARYRHLAPLHIPAGLEAIAATEEALPGVPQMGVFDTAFFADIPPAAYLYPVPYEWYTQWGIRRYGFHGTSHAYCTERAAQMLGRPVEELNLIICHLGQGGSATAVQSGKAITNTMGFTPLEGFMMGTRSGTVDPGILLYVMREHSLSVEELDYILHHRSGLLGLSGVSSDFRQVEAAAAQGNHRAQLALDVYAYRVRAMIGALAVTLGRVDALVFTGGIGENSSWLRKEVCRGLQCIGVHLDPEKNQHLRPDADIAPADSPARVLVIHTREDYMIARCARQMLLEQMASDS